VKNLWKSNCRKSLRKKSEGVFYPVFMRVSASMTTRFPESPLAVAALVCYNSEAGKALEALARRESCSDISEF
jgi:hypothetical protein